MINCFSADDHIIFNALKFFRFQKNQTNWKMIFQKKKN